MDQGHARHAFGWRPAQLLHCDEFLLLQFHVDINVAVETLTKGPHFNLAMSVQHHDLGAK